MELLRELDIRPIGNNGNKLRWAVFKCPICNEEVEKVKSNGLKQKECGCRGKGYNSRTHGMANTRIYKIWEDIKKRCDNPLSKHYHRYGGRGITYDPKWKDFMGFYEDMKEGYTDMLTIDRERVNENYNKTNCQWITKNENCGKDHRGKKQSAIHRQRRSESMIKIHKLKREQNENRIASA